MNKLKEPVKKLAPAKKAVQKKKAGAKSKSLMVAVNPEMLLTKAIEKGLPVETLERLMVMRRELRAEAARDDYFIALSRFQKICPIVGKRAVVMNKDEDDGERFRYAKLDHIVAEVKDALEECGFSYMIKTEQPEKSVKATCETHHVSGHSESTSFTIGIANSGYMNAAQEIATALAYSQRYAFKNAFGIITGEPDRMDYVEADAAEVTPKPKEEPEAAPKAGKKKAGKTLNEMADEALKELDRANLFPPNQRSILTDKVTELHKAENKPALGALLQSIERQAKTLMKNRENKE